MAKHYVAYRITNTVTGKSYVGITCMALKQRWWKHTSEARLGRDLLLHRAIREYGPDAFEMIPVASALTKADRWETERALISQLGTCGDGYNELPGVPRSASDPGVPSFFSGPDRRPIPEWQKERMRELFTGRSNSPETIENMRKAQRARSAAGLKANLRGYVHSEVSLVRRSISRGGVGRVIYDGVTYPCIRVAAIAAGVSQTTFNNWVRRHGSNLPRMIPGRGRIPARAA